MKAQGTNKCHIAYKIIFFFFLVRPIELIKLLPKRKCSDVVMDSDVRKAPQNANIAPGWNMD
jgi:hypothetical protein